MLLLVCLVLLAFGGLSYYRSSKEIGTAGYLFALVRRNFANRMPSLLEHPTCRDVVYIPPVPVTDSGEQNLTIDASKVYTQVVQEAQRMYYFQKGCLTEDLLEEGSDR